MKQREISTTVYLGQEQFDALKTLSGNTKVPYAEYARHAIDRFLTDVAKGRVNHER